MPKHTAAEKKKNAKKKSSKDNGKGKKGAFIPFGKKKAKKKGK